jgi:predicted transcriptional regulator
MRRTTILAEDELFLEARYLARSQGKTFSALVQDALRQYVERHRAPRRRISLAAIGRSGRARTQEEMDADLAAGLDRADGWSHPPGASVDTTVEAPPGGESA